jgi:hypothetical protein
MAVGAVRSALHACWGIFNRCSYAKFGVAATRVMSSVTALSLIFICTAQLVLIRKLHGEGPEKRYLHPRAPFANHLIRDWRRGMAEANFKPMSAAARGEGTARAYSGGWEGGKQGVGVYYVSYGRESARFVHDAYNSARRIRRLNSRIRTAIATNYRGPLLKEFNHTVHIPFRHFDASRQWLTRLFYLALSPFELTLEIDSTVTVCSTTLVEELEAEWQAKSFDFASQVERVSVSQTLKHIVHPHNFALMYFWNSNTIRLLSEWFEIYKDTYNTLDDQKTLSLAIQSPKLAQQIRIAKIKDSFALGFLSPSSCSPPGSQVRCTRAFAGKVSMFHSYDGKRVPAKYNRQFCDFLNSETGWRQILFKPSGLSDYRLFTREQDCKASGFGSICDYLLESGPSRGVAVEELPKSNAWIRAVRG